MRAFTPFALPLLLAMLAVAAMAPAPAAAQNELFLSDNEAEPPVPDKYTESAGQLSPTQIIQEKAQIRAAQRMSRIAAKDWFGYSQARPRTNATPFTGLYGPHFQGRALGRPAAFHVARPIVVVR